MLDLVSCFRGHQEATEALRALENNSALQQIPLYGNQLGDEGGAAIARSLENNSTLQQIDLGDNGVGGRVGKQ